MNKKDLKISLKLFLYLLVSVFIAALIYATVESVSIVLFTNQKGVNIYSNSEEGTVNSRTYYFKNEETVDDIELEENEYIGEYLNTEMPLFLKVAVGIVEQVALFLFLKFVNDIVIKELSRKHKYSHLFNGTPFDKYKGLKWGGCAALPFAIVYILLVVGKVFNSNALLNVYKTLNWQTLPLFKLICWGNPQTMADISWVSIILAVICWAILPVVTQVSFLLGANDGKLYNKIVYKN